MTRKSTQARIDNGTRSKNKWRRKFPAKARKRNAIDCNRYYHRNAERLNERRRELYKLRTCADILKPVTKKPTRGYTGTLKPNHF